MIAGSYFVCYRFGTADIVSYDDTKGLLVIGGTNLNSAFKVNTDLFHQFSHRHENTILHTVKQLSRPNIFYCFFAIILMRCDYLYFI